MNAFIVSKKHDSLPLRTAFKSLGNQIRKTTNNKKTDIVLHSLCKKISTENNIKLNSITQFLVKGIEVSTNELDEYKFLFKLKTGLCFFTAVNEAVVLNISKHETISNYLEQKMYYEQLNNGDPSLLTNYIKKTQMREDLLLFLNNKWCEYFGFVNNRTHSTIKPMPPNKINDIIKLKSQCNTIVDAEIIDYHRGIPIIHFKNSITPIAAKKIHWFRDKNSWGFSTFSKKVKSPLLWNEDET